LQEVELNDAINKANQILEEERSSPTVRYSLRLKEMEPGDVAGQLVTMVAMLKEPEQLQVIRSQRPRQIVEDPQRWAFKSVNYDLLCALHLQLPEDSRQAFLSSVLARLSRPPGCVESKQRTEPSWNRLVSEFPLIAEFCVRNGGKDGFLRMLGQLELFAGHAVLLRQVEDMIALNFTVLAEREYEVLAMAITALGYTARKQYQACRDSGATGAEAAQLWSFWRELTEAADGIKEECRKARYLYLRGALLEGFNLEVNQDKTAVESYLKAQGFSDGLTECLNRADQIYQSASSGFEFKSCMGHLRSFMEKLHSEGTAKLGPMAAGPLDQRWRNGLERLQQEGLLSKAEKGYASALYTLLSDTGVHPIIAEKEYARLARNVVIEYALLFLRKLEKRGFKLINGDSKRVGQPAVDQSSLDNPPRA
jgi:hypothetical protein